MCICMMYAENIVPNTCYWYVVQRFAVEDRGQGTRARAERERERKKYGLGIPEYEGVCSTTPTAAFANKDHNFLWCKWSNLINHANSKGG